MIEGLDIRQLLQESHGLNYQLHAQHVNPRFARALGLIGFDKSYLRASGPHLWDEQGNKYLDMLAGYGVFNMGRNHPAVKAALADFLQSDYPSLVQLEAPLLSGLLAEALKTRMPNDLDRVYFTSSGAEGVETAIKFARCATGRPAILYASSAFHGLTNGALALNGSDAFRQGFSPFLPDCREVSFNDLPALERALAEGDVAGYLVEPIQGKGVHIPSPGYLREAARLCRKHGALFIADEVQSGLGRTGRFLALEHDGDVDPDMVILAKSLSGGYVPTGAVLYRRWICDKVFSSLERAVVHSSTFGQGSFAMVAGLAALDVIQRERLAERAEQMGRRLGMGLQALAERYELIKDVRWRGLMLGIEFGAPRSLPLRTAWNLTHGMNKSLFCQGITFPLLEDHRILTQVAGPEMDVIKLIPPLVIDEADVAWFLQGFEAVMESLHRFPGPIWDTLLRIGRNALAGPLAAGRAPAA